MTTTTIDDRTIDAIDELAEGWDEGNWTAAHDELAKLAGYVDEAGEYDVHMVERDSTIVCYSLRGRVALAFSRGGSNWTWIATEDGADGDDVFLEGDYWRWRIEHNGREYLDGGNFLTREAAEISRREALATLTAR